MEQVLTPNRAEAQRFLDLLEPGGEFWFQTALEPRPKVKSAGGARVLHGTLDNRWDELARLNALNHAVWVQINAGTGRLDAEVTRVRSYFVDIDEGNGDDLLDAAVPSDIILETSPGKYHGSWFTGECPLDQFKPRQLTLAEKFGGDTTVCNLGRVMRLPGLIHQKGAPFLSRILRVREGL